MDATTIPEGAAAGTARYEADLSAEVAMAVGMLDPRSAAVFRSRHPVDGSKPVPPADVAVAYGISPSRVSQIDTAAALRLRSGPSADVFFRILRDAESSVNRAVSEARGPKTRDPVADNLLAEIDPYAAMAMKVVLGGNYVAWKAWKVRTGGIPKAPGQAHELPMAKGLLAMLPDRPVWVVADRGYASNAFREMVWDMGSRPAVPAKRNEAPVRCPSRIYRNRNVVERLWARLKEWRAVATRYEKTASSFAAVLALAATFDWIKM